MKQNHLRKQLSVSREWLRRKASSEITRCADTSRSHLLSSTARIRLWPESRCSRIRRCTLPRHIKPYSKNEPPIFRGLFFCVYLKRSESISSGLISKYPSGSDIPLTLSIYQENFPMFSPSFKK